MNQSTTTSRAWPISQLTETAATALVLSSDVPWSVIGQRLTHTTLKANSVSSIVGDSQDWDVTGSGGATFTMSSSRSHLALTLVQIAMNRSATARSLLRSWLEEDVAEQQSTLEYLMRALDADRTSDRELFP